MNDQKDLTLIIRSQFPIVVVETQEELRLLGLLERIANLEGQMLFVWSVADGLRRHEKPDPIPQTYQLFDTLRHIDKTLQNGIYVLLDAHPFLEDPVIRRLIREISLEYEKTARTLIFVSPKIQISPELKRMSARFELAVTDMNDIRAIFKEEADRWVQLQGAPVRGKQEAVDGLTAHLVGMCRDDARRLIRQVIQDDGMITGADLERVLRFKREALGDHTAVSLELDTGTFDDVAGLRNLKRWLDLRRNVFIGKVSSTTLDAPKGVLLLGVQGAGKSMAAKAIAGSWGVPLLRLDFGALYNKFHGETERNLRDALKAAEALAPCVLWIDEIEKGIVSDVSGSSDGGVSGRILGTLLTWMSERHSKVFLAATANSVTQLPPELLRKGRFDEIFFVDLPSAPTRQEIFKLHLSRRSLNAADFDTDTLSQASDGFSGAEIEQAIVSALYEAMAVEASLNTGHITQELQRTKPLSVIREEEITALRTWAAERTLMAE
ncbi:MAG: AAA family ATPase [Pseudomonadota bacterium]